MSGRPTSSLGSLSTLEKILLAGRELVGGSGR